MLITSSHTPNCLRQIALVFLFLILFSCARNQKLLFFFQSFKKRYFLFTRLCLFRCLHVIALDLDSGDACGAIRHIGIRTLKESRGLFYSPFPYVVFFNSVQFSWINPSKHTRIEQRVSMLSASGRLRVFSLCGGSPLV